MAQLQEHGAFDVEACSVYLKPLDQKGEHIALRDEKGEPVSRIDLRAGGGAGLSFGVVPELFW